MAKRAKQKSKFSAHQAQGAATSAARAAAVDNVIPLHSSRADARVDTSKSSTSAIVAKVTPEQPSPAASEQADADAQAVSSLLEASKLDEADDHHEVERFFSQPPPAPAPVQHEGWADLESTATEQDPAHQKSARSGMFWTIAILVLSLALIGGFLLYNKVLMPTPEEPLSGEVVLPTPELLRNAEILLETPKPEADAPVAPSEPADAPEAAPTAAAPSQPAAPAASPQAPAAPTGAPMTREMGSYAALVTEARKQGFKRNAESTYLQALTIHPTGSDALSGLAMLYLNQGKNKPARDRAREAVTADGNNAEGWIVLGAALSTLGDGAGARSAYSQCAATGDAKFSAECRRMLR